MMVLGIVHLSKNKGNYSLIQQNIIQQNMIDFEIPCSIIVWREKYASELSNPWIPHNLNEWVTLVSLKIKQ
jgi:hypothetical protein